MLVTLADMKTYLGISDNTYDTFLTEQLEVISEAVEGYCGRKFLEASWEETFYRDEFERNVKTHELFHYPVSAITAVEADGIVIDEEEYRLHKPTGVISRTQGIFGDALEDLVITYTAGFPYASLPKPLTSVVKSLVEERYNKKKSGVALNFGSDVQRVSIPGSISIDFDYSLNSNERKSAFGTLIGNFGNTLDNYRSDRAIADAGRISYVGPGV